MASVMSHDETPSRLQKILNGILYYFCCFNAYTRPSPPTIVTIKSHGFTVSYERHTPPAAKTPRSWASFLGFSHQSQALPVKAVTLPPPTASVLNTEVDLHSVYDCVNLTTGRHCTI